QNLCSNYAMADGKMQASYSTFLTAFALLYFPSQMPVTAHLSDLFPDNLVGFHGKFKAGAVAFVNGGSLRLVGVVYDAVFSIFHIGVNLHVVVGAEPAVQVFLIVG